MGAADRLQHSLVDVEDVDEVAHVRDMHVEPVSARDVDEFARRYHYTATKGSALWRWGLWHGVTLYGVVAYNIPTPETCACVFGNEHAEHVWHMGRLVLADVAPRNSESRLIGGSLRAIEREYPSCWAVLTYAATDVGHIGYVYQATNAIYTGTGGNARYYIDAEGVRHNNSHTNDRLAIARGWVPYSGTPKHRYVYLLGSKTQKRQRRKMLLLPDLPYPKAGPDHDGTG